MSIFIPGNVPSLKNNKQIITVGPRCGKCKRGKFPKPIPSKAVRDWRKATEKFWLSDLRDQFYAQLDLTDGPPYRIKFTFIRGSRHRFDYTNALDTVQDSMTHHKWIEDDNSDILRPVLGQYKYNKEEPGVRIKVLDTNG